MKFKFIFLFALFLGVLRSQGQSYPIVGLSLDKHSDDVTGGYYHAKDSLLATVSYDKSLRIWKLPDYRCLSVVRMPEDNGESGRLNFCVFHPDSSNLVLVAGKLSTQRHDYSADTERSYSFYVVDWKIGRIIDKIGAFNSEVHTMEFSPDKRFLAVAAEREEMALYLAGNMSFLKNKYFNDEAILNFYFINDSLLCVVTDTFIREFKISETPGAYTVVNMELLKKVRSKTSLCEYNEEKKKLFIHYHKYSQQTYYWKKGWTTQFSLENSIRFIEKNKYISLEQYNRSFCENITETISIDKSKLIYRNNKPLKVKVSPQGDSLYIHFSGEPLRCMIFPFRLKEVTWKLPSYLSPENKIKEGRYHIGNYGEWLVSLGEGIKMSDEENLFWEKNILSRSSGVGAFYEHSLPSNITGGVKWMNGQYVLLTTADGVIRWYDIPTGNEALALFVNRQGEWIYWTPEGYYYSDKPSNAAMIEWRLQKYMNVIVKKPIDVRANYYNREFIHDRLLTVYGLNRKNISSTGQEYLKLQNVFTLKYPEIKIDKVLYENKDSSNLITILYSVRNYNRNTYGYSEIRLEADQQNRPIHTHIKTSTGGIIEVYLPETTHTIQLGLWGDNSLLTYDKYELNKQDHLCFNQVYSILFGVSEYDIWGIPSLKSPVNDVHDFSTYLHEGSFIQKEKMFPQISTFLNQEVSKESVFNSLETIKRRAGENDLTVFYFSGHAFATSDNRYFLAPYGLKNIAEIYRKGIEINQLLDILNGIPGYKLMFLDACYSGCAVKKSYKQTAVFTSSQQNQTSLDGNEITSSIFTKILLEGLRQKIPSKQDGISLKAIKDYLITHVQKETNGKQQVDIAIDPEFENYFIIKRNYHEE